MPPMTTYGATGAPAPCQGPALGQDPALWADGTPRYDNNVKLIWEYNGDLCRHYIRNCWYEVGTKFDDCGTKFVEHSTKYNPDVIKYRPFMTKYTPRRREAFPRGVFAHLWSIFDYFRIVFRRNFDIYYTAFVKLRTNNCEYKDEKKSPLYPL